jgi:hypothetical protein
MIAIGRPLTPGLPVADMPMKPVIIAIGLVITGMQESIPKIRLATAALLVRDATGDGD